MKGHFVKYIKRENSVKSSIYIYTTFNFLTLRWPGSLRPLHSSTLISAKDLLRSNFLNFFRSLNSLFLKIKGDKDSLIMMIISAEKQKDKV